MSRKPPDSEFLAEIANQLKDGLSRRRVSATQEGKRFTRHDAAEELGISRASLQFYLAAKHMPGSDVLRRAMEIWKIDLTYRGRKLTVVDLALPTNTRKITGPEPVQLGLWDSIKKLDSNALSVRVIKKGQNKISLQVDVAFSA